MDVIGADKARESHWRFVTLGRVHGRTTTLNRKPENAPSCNDYCPPPGAPRLLSEQLSSHITSRALQSNEEISEVDVDLDIDIDVPLEEIGTLMLRQGNDTGNLRRRLLDMSQLILALNTVQEQVAAGAVPPSLVDAQTQSLSQAVAIVQSDPQLAAAVAPLPVQLQVAVAPVVVVPSVSPTASGSAPFTPILAMDGATDLSNSQKTALIVGFLVPIGVIIIAVSAVVIVKARRMEKESASSPRINKNKVVPSPESQSGVV